MKYAAVLRWLTPALFALALAACGGGDSNSGGGTAGGASINLSGTVATGAAMANANITIKGANGVTSSVTAGANGQFAGNFTGLTFPVLLQATNPANASEVLYAWAFAAGTVNITPLTSLALMTSPLPDNLNALFADWINQAKNMTQAAMRDAQATVNANLQSQLNAQTLSPQTYDFLRTAFSANGAGIDAVLDSLDFAFDFSQGSVTIQAAGTTTVVPFNAAISIAGFNIGGTTGTGTGTGGTSALTASSAAPASGNGTIAISAVKAEDAGTLPPAAPLTRVTVSGTAGGQGVEILIYFETNTGNLNTVTYQWGSAVPFSFPSAIGIAFCGDACGTPGAVAINTTTRTITLTNTLLDGATNNPPFPPTLPASVVLNGKVVYP